MSPSTAEKTTESTHNADIQFVSLVTQSLYIDEGNEYSRDTSEYSRDTHTAQNFPGNFSSSMYFLYLFKV